MTPNEKREILVKNVLTREKKNQYSQDINKRTMIESGYGDCSGTVWYWYRKLFGINIGANTEAQINSSVGQRVILPVIDGVPDESKLKKGDLLYFRGSDNSRTEGVGHVEMYIGNGKIFGHGSGKGGTVKGLRTYCQQRQYTSSTPKLKNKGLICVIRFIPDETEELTKTNDIIWELRHRNIITNSALWSEIAEKDSNVYWLIRKSLHYIRSKEEKGVTKNVTTVEELSKNGDNVWELQHRGIITNSALWKLKGFENANIYWLLRKIVYFIRKNNI